MPLLYYWVNYFFALVTYCGMIAEINSAEVIKTVKTMEVNNGFILLDYTLLTNHINQKLKLILEVTESNKEQLKGKTERLDFILGDNKENVYKKDQKNMNKKDDVLQEELYEQSYKKYEDYISTINTNNFSDIILKSINDNMHSIPDQEKKSIGKHFKCKVQGEYNIEDVTKADTAIRYGMQILADKVNEKLNEINELINEIKENELGKLTSNNRSNCDLFRRLVDSLGLGDNKIELWKFSNSEFNHNDILLIKGFLNIQESDYDNNAISNELIKAFTCEFSRQKNELLDDILDDIEITSDNEIMNLKKSMVELIKKIEEIGKSESHLINDRLNLLSGTIKEFDELFDELTGRAMKIIWNFDVVEHEEEQINSFDDFNRKMKKFSESLSYDKVDTMKFDNEITFSSFNDMVDKILATFYNIIEINSLREIEPINITNSKYKKIKSHMRTVWGLPLCIISKVFTSSLMGPKLELIKQQKKEEVKPNEKPINCYVKAGDMQKLATEFKELITIYTKATRDYLRVVLGFSAAKIVQENKNKKYNPDEKYDNDNYIDRLSHLIRQLEYLSKKKINNTDTVNELMNDIKVFELSKNQMIKDMFYPDDSSCNFDKTRYTAVLKKFVKSFYGKNRWLSNSFSRDDELLRAKIIAINNECVNLGFEDCWNVFKAINDFVTQISLLEKKYIKRELEENKLLKHAFEEFKELIKNFYCIGDNLIKKILSKEHKVNYIMVNYFIEQLKYFLEDAFYRTFAHKITWVLFEWDWGLEALPRFQELYASFINGDFLIYLSYLIKIMIPDISNGNKIDDPKSNKLISYFLLVRSIKESAEEIIINKKNNIKEHHESLNILCKAYLLYYDDRESQEIQLAIINCTIRKVLKDIEEFEKQNSELFSRIDKITENNIFREISEQSSNLSPLTQDDIEEILKYDNKKPLEELGKLGEDLVTKHNLDIPRCFSILNNRKDLTKENLQMEWLQSGSMKS